MNLLKSITNRDKTLVERFALSWPYLLTGVILFGLLFAFWIGRPDFAIRGLVIAIPGIIAAKVLTKMYKSEAKEASLNFAMNFDQKRLSIIFFILYALSSIIVVISSVRPWYYFVIMSLLYTIILFQILSKEVNQYLVLSEIILCMVNLIYSFTLKSHLYFGATDILPHLFMSQVTYLSGHTVPEFLSVGYAKFPLFHILISQASYLLNLDINATYFLISPLIFSTVVLFLYCIFLNTTKNIKLSLLSVVLFSTLSTVVYYEMYMITRVVAFIAFLLLMYLIYKNSEKRDPRLKILGIIVTIFIVLVHQVSTPQIIIVMALFFVSELILTNLTGLKSKFHDNNYILLLIVTFLAYWFYVAYSFIFLALTSRVAFASTELAIKQDIKVGLEWIFISQNVDTMIVSLFVFVGIGAIFWKYGKNYAAVFTMVSLFSLPLYLPNPLQTLWQTMTLFRFDRFMLLVSPFIAFSMAAGLLFCYNLLASKKKRVLSAGLIITILFSGFVYPSLTGGSPEYDEVISSRTYFYSDELIGFDHVFDSVPDDSRLYTDYPTSRLFANRKLSETDNLGIKYYRIVNFDVLNFNLTNGYFILRNTDLDRGLTFEPTVIRGDNSFEWDNLSSNLETNNKIYSNSAISIYGAF
ncbi:hypothetical protein [Methanococcoides sp. AM1]|uniref:hypothetical protein n=1 Tax=Methanococcoides sp. AM1 TaxID=1201011 RepID=UPI001083BEBC|nr:hypothetical protein [Methanococcoides sp. AM1]